MKKILIYFGVLFLFFALPVNADWNDLINENNKDFEILFSPTSYTSYNLFENKFKIKAGGIWGLGKIIRKNGAYSFYTKAKSQNGFMLRSNDLIIKQKSFGYIYLGKAVNFTFSCKEKFGGKLFNSIHTFHLVESEGKIFYTYYNSLKNTIYTGGFKIKTK